MSSSQVVSQSVRWYQRHLSKRTRRSLKFDVLRIKAKIRSRFRGKVPTADRLHLGCGARLVPGWLNVDVVGSQFDIDLGSGRLPFAAASFSAVVSQQVIEHLDLEEELLPLLKDLVRVCKPAAEVWLSCPDMQRICQSYLADGGIRLLHDRLSRFPAFALRGLPTQHMLNVWFHQGGEHINLFDFELLRFLLDTAGFVRCDRVSEADLRVRFPEFPARNDEEFSLYVRALAPP